MSEADVDMYVTDEEMALLDNQDSPTPQTRSGECDSQPLMALSYAAALHRSNSMDDLSDNVQPRTIQI